MEIGQKIKEARIAKGLTQEDLGNIVGVQKSAIAKYESGRVVNIKRSMLRKLADALGIRPSELIFESNPAETADLHARILLDHALMDMIEEYLCLDKNNQDIVKNLIHSLGKK